MTDLAKFFDAKPNVNLDREYIDDAMVSGVGASDEAQLKKDLRAYQRLYRLLPGDTNRGAGIQALFSGKLRSARSIARLGRRRFLSQFGATLGEDTAKEVFGKAQARHATATLYFLQNHQALSNPPVDAVPCSNTSEISTTLGGYASLFGSFDYCTCGHCRSALSPAAYLVDLLMWARDRGDDGEPLGEDWVSAAFDELMDRRPDLGTAELTCENTNRVLPYVDLVIEILEAAVLQDGSPEGDHDRTEGTRDERLAQPQYLRPEAYAVLKDEVYPPTLPFDLDHATAGAYLRHLGVPRHELMRTFQQGSDPSDPEIGAETLGLPPAAYALITTQAANPHLRWGFSDPGGDDNSPSTTWYEELSADVDDLKDRAEIELEDLLDLLHARAVNPTGVVTVDAEDYCDLSDWTLENTTADFFDCLARFVRLWRATGWSILDVDKAMKALSATSLDPVLVRQLGDIRRLSGRLDRVPLLTMLTWWGTIDTYEDRDTKDEPDICLFDQVFRSRALYSEDELSDPTFPFTLIAARSELLDTDPAIDQFASDLAAIAGGTVEDIEYALADAVSDPSASGTLTLANVSRVYATVTFARAAGLRVRDLVALWGSDGLVGIDPFESPSLAWEFLDELEVLQRAGLTADELLYLLEHDSDAAERVAPTDDWIQKGLGKIRDDVLALQQASQATEDRTEAALRDLLAKLVDDDDEIDVLVSIVDATADEAPTSPTMSYEEQEEALSDWLGDYIDIEDAADHLIETSPSNEDLIDADDLPARYAYMVDAINAGLLRIQCQAVVVEDVATLLEREVASIEALRSIDFDALSVTDFVEVLLDEGFVDATSDDDDPWADITRAEQSDAFDVIELLWKVARVLRAADVDADEQQWWCDQVASSPVVFELIDLSTLPLNSSGSPATAASYADMVRTLRLFSLRSRIPGSDPQFYELMNLLATSTVAEFLDELAARTDWDPADLVFLAGSNGWDYTAADLADPEELGDYLDRLAIVRRVGSTADIVLEWRDYIVGPSAAEEIVGAARGRYDSSKAWSRVARPIRDRLREAQRKALVSYLVANDSDVSDVDELYGKYLIDVEMSPCMLTSRLKQAIASVQLFIQRWMMGLESSLENLTPDDHEQWEWMKNYRVWEAARKVLLYPENWIEPELLDEKTELYEELESALLQGELSDDNVEAAVVAYLEGLRELSNMRVVSLYEETVRDEEAADEDDEGSDEEETETTYKVLHVVGRTQGKPSRYYYRRHDGDTDTWTSWEHVDVDVEGDHLAPIVWNKRLYLFWATLVEKAWTSDLGDGSVSNHEYWEVHLHWSEYKDGAWTRKRSAEAPSSIDSMGGHGDIGEYSLRASSHSDGIVVEAQRTTVPTSNTGTLDAITFAVFYYSPATGTTRTEVGDYCSHVFIENVGMEPYYQGLWLTDTSSLSLPIGDVTSDLEYMAGTSDAFPTFLRANSSTSLTAPHQVGAFVSQARFFLQDSQRSYLVKPQRTGGSGYDTGGIRYWEPVFDSDDMVTPPDIGLIFDTDLIRMPEYDQATWMDNVFEDSDWNSPIANTDPGAFASAEMNTQMQLEMRAALDLDFQMGQNTQEVRLCSSTGGEAQHVTALSVTLAKTGAPTTDDYTSWRSAARSEGRFRFYNFYHPYLVTFLQAIAEDDVWALEGLTRSARAPPAIFCLPAGGTPA